jgi:hypothetical protein
MQSGLLPQFTQHLQRTAPTPPAGTQAPDTPFAPITKEQERQILEQQVKALEAHLEALRKRLEELKK